jgi:putative DNA primase/helicase
MDSVLTELKSEIDGFLQWALIGYQRVRAQGFKPPVEVVASTIEYKQSQDILGIFLAECCNIESNREIKSKPIYKAYIDWCKENAIRPEFHAHTTFRYALEKPSRGFDTRTDCHNVIYIIGLDLKNNLEKPDGGENSW